MTQSAIFTVPPEENLKRLDLFLVSQMRGFSRTQVQALITAGQVEALFKLKAVRSNLIVSTDQSFRVTVPASQAADISPENIKLDIVYEDRSLMVVNKPAGLVVHPGAGNPSHTLINALVAHCPHITGVGGVKRPGLVHRLDKDTSGLLVVAKTDRAYQGLVTQLKTRTLSRQYLGIVKGSLSEKGMVDAAIGRHATARKKMAVQAESGKPSVTHFLSLEHNLEASLMLFKLETGRTHQIRVHMAYIHHPIWGDTVYGGESSAGRQMLHAFRLSFKHPQTGRTQSFWVSPPPDFIRALSSLNLSARKWHGIRWKDQ